MAFGSALAALGGIPQGIYDLHQDQYRQALAQQAMMDLQNQMRQRAVQNAAGAQLFGGGAQNPFGQPGVPQMPQQQPQSNYATGAVQGAPLAGSGSAPRPGGRAFPTTGTPTPGGLPFPSLPFQQGGGQSQSAPWSRNGTAGVAAPGTPQAALGRIDPATGAWSPGTPPPSPQGLPQQPMVGPQPQPQPQQTAQSPQPFDPAAVARAIHQAHPEMEPRDVLAATMEVSKQLAPQYEHAYKRWEDEQQRLIAGHREERETASARDLADYRKQELANAKDRLGIEARSAADLKGYRAGETARAGIHPITITNPDGTTRQVMAQEISPGNVVDMISGQRIDPATVSGAAPSTGRGNAPGRQAAQQITALIGSGNEVEAALKNLVDLPIGATASWVGGIERETPGGLTDGIRRSLANSVTPDEARALEISFSGVSQAIALIENAGRATGNVGLRKRAEALMPRAGDPNTSVLRSYAEIRQLVEQGMENVKATPDISQDQRKLLDKIAASIKETIPWTVKDVNALERDPSDERVTDFAKRMGAGGAATGGEAPEVSREQYDKLPSGSPYKVPGDPTVRYKQ